MIKPTTQRAKRIAIVVLLVVIAVLKGDDLTTAITLAAKAMISPTVVANSEGNLEN